MFGNFFRSLVILVGAHVSRKKRPRVASIFNSFELTKF